MMHGKIKIFFFTMIAGLLMIVSWSSFYLCANPSSEVLDASLGYFISPLFVIALGCIFLKKNCVSLFQAIAVFWCLWPDFSNYHATAFPGIALTMGLSFALYGWRGLYIMM